MPPADSFDEATSVTGLVGPRGASGGRLAGAEDWTLQFDFVAWRRDQGEINARLLAVQRRVSHDELRSLMDRIKADQFLCALVHFTGPVSAELVQVIGVPTTLDKELVRYAADLLRPVTYEHKKFGTFALDRRTNIYTANTLWGVVKIRLNLKASDDATLAAALKEAEELWSQQEEWGRRVREYAAEKLLELKNESWFDEDEGAVSSHDFKRRMKLVEVSISSERSFDFWHDDDGMFGGHTIWVGGNLQDGPTDADIPG